MSLLTQKADTKFVLFGLNNYVVAIHIHEIREIIAIQAIHPVPNTHNHILGVIHLRGEIIPIVPLRTRFQMEEVAFTNRSRIVIVEHNNEWIGIVVDTLEQVIYVKSKDITDTATLGDDINQEYFQRFIHFNHQCIGILNIQQILKLQES